MSFTSKQRADYIEMISELLDKIRVTKLADFDNVIIDLGKILSSGETNVIDFHQDLKYGMDFIFDCLQRPELYVESEGDYPEYKQIIKDRISGKIKEFTELTPAQKQQYIENQQQLRDQAAAHQEIMAAVEPRREADARTQREERERLVREQFEIEAQIRNGLPGGISSPAFFRPRENFHPNIGTLVRRQLITQEQARALTDAESSNLIEEHIFSLICSGQLTVDQARVLSDDERRNLTDRHIFSLIGNGLLTADQAKALRYWEYTNLNRPNVFALIGSGLLTAEQAKALTVTSGENGTDERNERENLTDRSVFSLICSGQLTVDQARTLTFPERYHLHNQNIFSLIGSEQLTVPQAIALTYDEGRNLTDSALSIFIGSGRATVAQIKALSARYDDREIELRNFVGEKYIKLFEEVRRIINQPESSQTTVKNLSNDNIISLICSEQLTIDQAKVLTNAEFKILSDPNVFSLICSGQLTLAEALDENEMQNIDRFRDQWSVMSVILSMPTGQNLFSLVCSKLLTLDQARVLTGDQYENLLETNVLGLIGSRQLTVERAMALTIDQRNIIANPNVFSLIGSRQLTVDQALMLTVDERNNIDSSPVFSLIGSRQLTVDQARDLSAIQRGRITSGEDISTVVVERSQRTGA